jgi:hypothetical protein
MPLVAGEGLGDPLGSPTSPPSSQLPAAKWPRQDDRWGHPCGHHQALPLGQACPNTHPCKFWGRSYRPPTLTCQEFAMVPHVAARRRRSLAQVTTWVRGVGHVSGDQQGSRQCMGHARFRGCRAWNQSKQMCGDKVMSPNPKGHWTYRWIRVLTPFLFVGVILGPKYCRTVIRSTQF